MAVVELDFYEPDGTTLIGSLDDSELIECEARPALQELGALRFILSRHLAAASSAMLAKGNFVKVTYPVIDPDPICVFVLKDDTSALVDKDEQGGEHLEVTGPGALWILQHARLRYEVYAPEQPTRGDWDDDVSWNWRNRPYGGILVRAIEEGQNQPGTPLAAISIDFDRTVDSDGVPWAAIAEDFSVPIGTDVLSLAQSIATAGDLFLVLTPDMVLHAYQTFGRNLTGAFAADNVRFEKDVNIQTELERQTQLDRVTHLITRDLDGVYRTYVTPDAYDQAVYGYQSIDWTNDPDQVEKTALNLLASSDSAAELYTFEISPGTTPAEGEYLPGPDGTDGHFWIGDETTLHTGSGTHDLNAVSAVVADVSIVLDIAADDSTDERSARSLHIVPKLSIGVPPPNFSGVGSNPTARGGVGCICLKLCRPAVPDFTLYDLDWAGVEEHTVAIYPSGTGTWPIDPVQVESANGPDGLPGVVGWGGSFSDEASGPKIPATAGVTYRWTGSAWTNCDGGEVLLRVKFYNAADVLLQTNTLAPGVASGDETWHTYTQDFLAPANTAYMQLEPGAIALCAARYDDIQVVQAGTGDQGDVPQDVGLEASAGTSVRASRCDHVHEHGLLSPAETHMHGTAQIQGYVAPSAPTAAQVQAAGRWEPVTSGVDVFVWDGNEILVTFVET